MLLQLCRAKINYGEVILANSISCTKVIVDENIPENLKLRTSVISHEDNNTINEGHLECFTQVQRRRCKTISMNPPNEVTEDEQLYYEVGYSSHPMITRSQSKRPQNESDYFLYPVDDRFDSPHKLATALQRFRLSRPEETTFRPYLKRAIRFHNKYNRSISASIGIPQNNFNC
ncbi:unnamed protein product [Cuscuta europaea]|uniref:Uncharacterized protein n=1 Tax=Cuscuta europaea TaxID=41803 RepID=A0A9P0YM03_CUSEU|nr:unnamed protein product [Cuscuta europaea]